jgi:hypothetical protein
MENTTQKKVILLIQNNREFTRCHLVFKELLG